MPYGLSRMDALTYARGQMEVSLGFHMVFAALGIGMPAFVAIAHGASLRTGDPQWRRLARRWARASALLFVVGAVSGTALSFELGLLWPRWLGLVGPMVGPAFTVEGFFFFTEAIFLGLYLYGEARLSPRAHFAAGIAVAVSGMLSGVVVLAANAFMQAPGGFTVEGDGLRVTDASFVLTNPRWFPMALHSTLSCYAAVAFGIAGFAAKRLLAGDDAELPRRALRAAMIVGSIAILLQPLAGDLVARAVAEQQPAKLAAMEALYETEAGAPMLVGGLPDDASHTVHLGLRIPKLLSVLVAHDPNATVRGIDSFPQADRPNTTIVHLAYQTMLGTGSALMALAVAWIALARKLPVPPKRLLFAIAAAGPLGFVALETGWVVAEAGRQPWIVQGVMRTKDAVTGAAGVGGFFFAFTALYLGLGAAVAVLLHRLSRMPLADDEKLHGGQTADAAP